MLVQAERLEEGMGVASGYVELHCKSFYSFGMGASHVHELLAAAKEYGYSAMALTDTNLCGALEFARLANSLGIQPVTGGELTLTDNTRLVLLARTRKGYANLSRLFTLANGMDRKDPRLDPEHLSTHSEGLILLTGGRQSRLSQLVRSGRVQEAQDLLHRYRDWFGPDHVYVELQQNLLEGDTRRNRELSSLACTEGVPVVATNDVHYHTPDRYRLQNAIASQCSFDLSTDLGYRLPEPQVPKGHTPDSYLYELCLEAAVRRYGSVTPPGNVWRKSSGCSRCAVWPAFCCCIGRSLSSRRRSWSKRDWCVPAHRSKNNRRGEDGDHRWRFWWDI